MVDINNKVCIALDFQTKEEVEQFLLPFKGQHLFVKVGMELFYGQGIEIISMIKKLGHHIFLDLKLHDIPNTVKNAMFQLARLGVDMVNVHASGGIAMMQAAIAGLEEGKIEQQRPLCIAVTCLTSLDQQVLEQELLIHQPLEQVVLQLAKNTKQAGLDGIVCSPWESSLIHEQLGNDFITVTPGIRLPQDSADDQKRIATPSLAKKMTSTYIVVGRSITKAKDTIATYQQVCTDFQN